MSYYVIRDELKFGTGTITLVSQRKPKLQAGDYIIGYSHEQKQFHSSGRVESVTLSDSSDDHKKIWEVTTSEYFEFREPRLYEDLKFSLRFISPTPKKRNVSFVLTAKRIEESDFRSITDYEIDVARTVVGVTLGALRPPQRQLLIQQAYIQNISLLRRTYRQEVVNFDQIALFILDQIEHLITAELGFLSRIEHALELEGRPRFEGVSFEELHIVNFGPDPDRSLHCSRYSKVLQTMGDKLRVNTDESVVSRLRRAIEEDGGGSSNWPPDCFWPMND